MTPATLRKQKSKDPKASEPFDVAVIGAGPGGYVAAIRAGQLGLRTCVIDDRPLGGVCLNVGCIPSKAFITAGHEFKAAVEGKKKGIHVTGAEVDMQELVAYKDGVVKKLNQGVAGLLKANKVKHVHGRATFTGATSLEVPGHGRIDAKNIIVATGSAPIEIPGFPFDEKRVLSSTGMLELAEVPRHLVVVGAGVIGLELACAMRNLGCEKVTVLEMMDQVLPGTDPDIAQSLQRLLQKQGFTFHLGARAKAAKVGKNGVRVSFEDSKTKEHTLDASHCLVAVGRRPNTRDLALDTAGVQVDERGFVPTDMQGRTNVQSIYAIGDITHGPMLAHKASKEGIVAAEAIAGDKGAAKDWKAIPGVIFTDPEVATAGLTEADAKAAGHQVRVGKFNVAALGKALADDVPDGFYKVIADAKTDQVLGVHILAAHAADLISEAALAIEMGATAADLALTVHPHPTMSEGIMEAAEAAHGKAIHSVNR